MNQATCLLAALTLVAISNPGCDRSEAAKQPAAPATTTVADVAGSAVKDFVKDAADRFTAERIVGRWYGVHKDVPFVEQFHADGRYLHIVAYSDLAGAFWGTWTVKDRKLVIDLPFFTEVDPDVKEHLKRAPTTPNPNMRWAENVEWTVSVTDERLTRRRDVVEQPEEYTSFRVRPATDAATKQSK